MDRFRVVDVSSDGTLVVLRDQSGANHVGRVTSPKLTVHDEVLGASARLGFQVLMSHDSTRYHRVILEALDCSHAEAVSRVQLAR